MNPLIIDIETRSLLDITKDKIGSWIYSRHPSTQVVCVCYSFLDEEKVNLWTSGMQTPYAFKTASHFVAHSALFEYAHFHNILIPKHQYPKEMKVYDRWECTVGMARCLGLPGKLGELGEFLQIKNRKLAALGASLIEKLCKGKIDEETGKVIFVKPTKQERKDFFKYCAYDVLAAKEIYSILRRQKNVKLERRIWVLDFKQNLEGIPIDTKAMQSTKKEIDKRKAQVKESAQKKFGINSNSYKQFLNYIEKYSGKRPENAQEQTLKEYRKQLKDPHLLSLFDHRFFSSRSSMAKIDALERTVDLIDSRLRLATIYFGAHTGRWAGSGFQVHNLPKTGLKPSSEKIDGLIEAVKNGKVRFKDFIPAIKQIVPGLICAEKDYIFLGGDFSAIEARIVAHISGEENLLSAYRSGIDVYKKMGGLIFNVPISSIEKGSNTRGLGKQVVLGCGYGMGWKKFIVTCWDKAGMVVSEKLAKHAVYTYRNTNPKVKQLWYSTEANFRWALREPGKVVKTNFLEFKYKNGYISIRLPSGRKLYYHKPKATDGDISFLSFRGAAHRVHTYGGSLVENIVQAIARDLLADCMVECDQHGLNPVLSVHDEIICHIKKKNLDRGQRELIEIMNMPSTWFEGFMLETEVENTRRYRKG